MCGYKGTLGPVKSFSLSVGGLNPKLTSSAKEDMDFKSTVSISVRFHSLQKAKSLCPGMFEAVVAQNIHSAYGLGAVRKSIIVPVRGALRMHSRLPQPFGHQSI